MGISIKQLILNTKIIKKIGGASSQKSNPKDIAKGLISKTAKEEIIQECMQRVEEYIEYELKP